MLYDGSHPVVVNILASSICVIYSTSMLCAVAECRLYRFLHGQWTY